jgi:hypothetical protein
MNDLATIVLATPHRRHDGLETVLRGSMPFTWSASAPDELSAAGSRKSTPATSSSRTGPRDSRGHLYALRCASCST